MRVYVFPLETKGFTHNPYQIILYQICETALCNIDITYAISSDHFFTFEMLCLLLAKTHKNACTVGTIDFEKKKYNIFRKLTST